MYRLLQPLDPFRPVRRMESLDAYYDSCARYHAIHQLLDASVLLPAEAALSLGNTGALRFPLLHTKSIYSRAIRRPWMHALTRGRVGTYQWHTVCIVFALQRRRLTARTTASTKEPNCAQLFRGYSHATGRARFRFEEDPWPSHDRIPPGLSICVLDE